MTTNYNELMTLWQDLDLCYEDKCTKDSVQFIKMQENDRAFVFLAGLSRELDEGAEFSGRLLCPLFVRLFQRYELLREESQQRVMIGKLVPLF